MRRADARPNAASTRRSSAVLTCAIAALAACTDHLAVLPPPPIDTGVRTLVLAMDTGTDFEVRVIEVKDGAAVGDVFPINLSKPVPAGNLVVLEALAYVDSPSELGLTPGVLAPSSTPNGIPLRTAPSIRRLDVDPADLPDALVWRDTREFGGKLATFRIDGPTTSCATFDVMRAPLGMAVQSPIFGAEVSPGAVLVGTDLESFFRLRVDEVALLTDASPQGYRSMAFAGSNTLWFGGDFGVLARGHVEPQLRIDQTLQTTTQGLIRWVAAGPAADGRDVFTLTLAGALEHHGDAGSNLLHQFPRASMDPHPAALVWVGPREAIVAWASLDRAVLRAKYVNDRWEVAPETMEATAAFVSAMYNPLLGEVIANSDGQFFANTGRGWQRLEGSELRVWPFVLTAYEDGFVYGTAFGNFGQYTPRDGFCPIAQVQGGDIRQIIVAGRDIVLLGPAGGRQPSYVWMKRL